MVALADDKGIDFAQMVVSSDRWPFPRMSVTSARELLAAHGEFCRCARCRGNARAEAPEEQLSLFDI